MTGGDGFDLDDDLPLDADMAVDPRTGHYALTGPPPPDSEDDPAPRRSLGIIEATSLEGQPVPPRGWHVADLIPSCTVTTANGDGGSGKSLLGLQLAVATARGTPWLGLDVTQGRALFVTAEDSADELHRRLAAIVADLGIAFADLDGLSLLSLAGEDALLAVPTGRSAVLAPTDLYRALDDEIGRLRPALVVLDTLADLFGGSEIDRAQARQFVGLLRGLAMRHDTTILLLAHPSLSGMSNGSGSSGSTAWNASVRARLYLERVKVDGVEPDPDARILRSVKSNYSRTGSEIRIRWERGVFVPADGAAPLGGVSAIAARAKADRVFLELVAAYEAEGRPVGPAAATNYAPSQFARDTRAEGVGKRALQDAMNRLFASGRIRVEEYGPASKRRKKIVLTGGTDDD